MKEFSKMSFDFDPRNFDGSIQKVLDSISRDHEYMPFEFSVSKQIDNAELHTITFNKCRLK